VAIETARRPSIESGVAAEFVCCNLYDVREVLDSPGRFDIVFTSYGVINWLPDLASWGSIVAHYLKSGGFFYIAEAHPTARIFPMDEDLPQAGSLRPWFPYFHDPAGIRWSGSADYADPATVHRVGDHEWQHSMADVVNALIAGGLAIDWLHEFPFCAWRVVAGCEVADRSGPGPAYYGLPPSQPQIPLMFSIRARKR